MSSKFASLVEAKRESEPRSGSATATSGATAVDVEPIVEPLRESGAGEPRRRGRPKGKRSDPAYTQVTLYLPKDAYRRAQIEILEGREYRDVSELAGHLLAQWLAGGGRTAR